MKNKSVETAPADSSPEDVEDSPLLISSVDSESNIPESKEEKRTRLGVTLCILFTELCERLTYYSIVGNLVLFLTNFLGFGSADAVTITLIFTGTCYFLPIVGGWLADSVAGCYNVIFGAGLIYIVGTFALPLVAFDYSSWGWDNMSEGAKRGFFLFGLTLIAIGTAGIKANVSPFGAQQLESAGPHAVQVFFNWFYWFINVGAVIAYGGVMYVQQEISFEIGYLIPAISMVVAVIIFVLAGKKYKRQPPGGSVLTRTFKITTDAISIKKTSIYKYSSFLDFAKFSNGGDHIDKDVDDVKQLGGILPVFGCIIFYNTVYSQMGSTFLLQAERMNLALGDFTLPAASLNLFDSLVILVLVPFMDRIVYPLLDKCWKRPSQLVRIGFGMILAVSSMVVAGILEIYRKEELSQSGGFSQEVAEKYFNASHYSVLLQVPQFVLIGASEVFAMVTGLEFAYSEAPSSLKGVVMGMFLVTSGLGNYIGSLLINIVNAATAGDEWYPDEINTGHLDYYFFLVGGLMMLNTLVYFIIAYRYKKVKYKKKDYVIGYYKADASKYNRLTDENNADVTVVDEAVDT
ncbi:solute carrier family 15 member 4-like [Lineus longissimus]|uniref:solute carrier family 15 member 4-like n=1 Tax=Lineus longissimus TaxID=88925 RepID=UPI002B4FA917